EPWFRRGQGVGNCRNLRPCPRVGRGMLRPLPLLLVCAAATALEVSEDQFTRADRDGDGVVTRAELAMPRVFKALDRDGDGRISRVEAGLDPAGPRGEIRVPPRRLPKGEAPLLGQRLDL